MIVDWNRQQALGLTRDVIDIAQSSGTLARFWLDGPPKWTATPSPIWSRPYQRDPAGQPHIILAHTVFGRGVSYMEAGQPLTQTHLPVQPINWHYLPMSDHEFEIAMREVEAAS